VKYLIEAYATTSTGLPDLEVRARLAADELSRPGRSVRYLRSTYVPEDHLCLHVFEAPSIETVHAASERAGLSALRIVEALEQGHAGGA
jgi:Nickel responsive protein SCO4226-like